MLLFSGGTKYRPPTNDECVPCLLSPRRKRYLLKKESGSTSVSAVISGASMISNGASSTISGATGEGGGVNLAVEMFVNVLLSISPSVVSPFYEQVPLYVADGTAWVFVPPCNMAYWLGEDCTCLRSRFFGNRYEEVHWPISERTPQKPAF